MNSPTLGAIDPTTLIIILVVVFLLAMVILWFRFKENRRLPPELEFKDEPELEDDPSLPLEERLLRELQKQTAAVHNLRAEVGSLARKGKRTWYIVILDVLLSITVAVAFSLALVSFEHSNNLEKSTQQTCVASNQSRIANQQLWQFVLGEFRSVTPTSDTSGTQKLNDIQKQVNTAFKLRDCDRNGTVDKNDVK